MIRRIVVVALVVFCTAEIGILTRPIGFFATLWPANAVLLGLFVIRPSLAGPWGWVAAVLAYLAAGHVSGDAPLLNLWLTAANLAGIVAGFILLRRLDAEDRALQRPSSVLRMLLVCIVAAVAAAIAGCGLGLLVPSSLPRVGFAYWFTTELANYVVILPVLLTLPEIPARGVMLDRLARFRPSLATIMPVVALGLSVVGSIVIGGPGAIAFPVPALLWCSLTYGLFPVTLLVLLSSLAMLGAETADLFRFVHVEDLIDSATSFRLGLTLLALGPLTVATITAVHRKLMLRLDRAVRMDGLTDILARRAYLDQSAALLSRPRPGFWSGVAVLMIDVDHFKQVNDRYGHASGDAVLVAVTDAISGQLRRNDLFGRIGGEEFAITLPDIASADAVTLAERLRHAVERLSVKVGEGQPIRVSVSIGVVHRSRPPAGGLIELLPLADAALYEAKATGRNRIVLCSSSCRAMAAAE